MTCPEGMIDVAAAERALLARSALGGLSPDEGIADLFCGAGGWGEGAKRHGIRVQAAVNHWDQAITTHARNNAGCAHHLGDAWKAKPRDVMRMAKIRRLGLLLASAACTSHSRAKGSAPVSKRVHMLGWCIARWLKDGQPRVAWIENVPEWQEWGPLVPKRNSRGRVVKDKQGRVVMVQDPERKGQHFRKWWRYCERLGYTMEMRVLEAPDFGAASRRTRLYIQARRDGMPLVWPEKTHGKSADSTQCAGVCGADGADASEARSTQGRPAKLATNTGKDAGRADGGGTGGGEACDERHTGNGGGGVHRRGQLRDDDCGLHRSNRGRHRPYRSAAEIIDWSDLGTSIFERPRPLKPKTLARIAEGIRRFVLNDPQPFTLRVTQSEGKGWHVWPVDQPMPTQTTRQDVAVCTPILAPQNSGVFGQRVDQPGPAITTKGHQALITPLLMHNTSGHAGGPVRGPIPTVTTGGQTGLVAPVIVTLRNHVAPTRPDGEPLSGLCAGGTHHALVAALLCTYYGNSTTLRPAAEALGCVTTLDRHALVSVVIHGQEYVIVDILFRMLRPHELALAMGFPAEYQWPQSQRDATRLIGNAVHVDVAAALIGASLPRGRMGQGRRAVA